MTVHPFLSVFAATLEIVISIYVLAVDPRARANRLFSFLCLLHAEWSICFALFTSAADLGQVWAWYRASTAGWILTAPFIIHFLLLVSGRARLSSSPLFLVVLYAPAPAFLVQSVVGRFFAAGFERAAVGWVVVPARLGPWEFAFLLYASLGTLGGLLSVYLWGRASDHRADRLQSGVITISGLAALVLGGLFPQMSLLADLVWIVGIGYAMARLNLMRLTFQNAAHDMLRTMHEGIIMLGRGGLIMDANPTAVGMLGKERSAVIGRTIHDILPSARALDALAPEHPGSADPIRGCEVSVSDPGGKTRFLSLSASRVADRFGDTIGVVALLSDVSDIKEAEQKVRFMATHDPLTNLPNRFLLNDRLRMAIGHADRSRHRLAVMLMDVDNFKTINDTLGHGAGDEVLRSFSGRVSLCLRANDTLSRMGGDEFVAVLGEIKAKEDAGVVAARILQALEKPFPVEGRDVAVTSSIGISICPDDSDNLDALLRNADNAMYATKKAGRNGYRYYSQITTPDGKVEVVTEQALSRALADHQLELYYQPICDLDSGTVSLAEVLLRWNHPEAGLLPASSFIPFVERTRHIGPINEWVFQSVCAQKLAWARADGPGISLAVNISARGLRAEGFVGLVERALAQTGVAPTEIFFELTESVASTDVQASREAIQRLADLGIRFIIDDFGPGSTSLRWLKTMPIYAVKVDRFFVQSLGGDRDNADILRAITSMAHSLDLKVIAEGVETPEQVSALRSLDLWEAPSLRCDSVQGYFLGRPMPAQSLEEMMRAAK